MQSKNRLQQPANLTRFLAFLVIFLMVLGFLGLIYYNPAWANVEGHHAAETVSGGHASPPAAAHAERGREAHGGHSPAAPEQPLESVLPLFILGLPVLGAILYAISRRRKSPFSQVFVIGSIAGTLLLTIAMYQPVINGVTKNGVLYRGLSATLPFLPQWDITFRVDPVNLLIALVTTILWTFGSIYALSYMTIEKNHTRYNIFMLLTLTSDLGVLLAGDLLTLFIFFEGLIIFPYPLVAHKQDEKALKGANMYLYLGVVSSLCLLAGIALMYSRAGNLWMKPSGETIAAMLPGTMKYVMAGLMIIGFGGKAGLFFEHIWLPNAHPVAPTPASSLLSGAMIKAGAYGIFRVVQMYTPSGESLTAWLNLRSVGYFLIFAGVVTMFLGVLNALITPNSKRMLAFHSVSQMGYIILGIGCAGYMGSEGAMGLAGAMYHAINHALFKALLFLCVGAVYYRTHELDMYNLGGLRRNMPEVAVALLIAVCGIAGIPGFNGFASKTVLHHAILEAYEFSGQHGEPDGYLRWAEILFMLTAGGTFASNFKLFMLTFMGERPKKYENIAPAPWPMRIALGGFSLIILFIGLNPNWLVERFIGPAFTYFRYQPHSHAYHILYNLEAKSGLRSTIPLLYPMVAGDHEAVSTVLHNLMGAGTAVMLGGMYFVMGFKYHLFHITVPLKYELEYYYKSVYHGFIWLCRKPATAFSQVMTKAVLFIMVDLWLPLIHPLSRVMVGETAEGEMEPEVLYQPAEETGKKRTLKGYRGLVYLCHGPINFVSQKLTQAVVFLVVDVWLPLKQPISTFLAKAAAGESSEPLEPAFVYAREPRFIDSSGNQAVAADDSQQSNGFCRKYVPTFCQKLEQFIVYFNGPVKKPAAYLKYSTVDDVEDHWYGITGWGYHGFVNLCRGPMAALSQRLDEIIIHFMVDIWLPLEQPLNNLLARPVQEQGGDSSEMEFKYTGKHPPMEETWQATTARGYLHSSNFLNLFDLGVIDKAVNNLAAAFGKVSDKLRKFQTGDLQNYLLVVFIGLTIISSFFLLNTTFYYGNLIIILQKAWLTLR